MGGNAIPYFTLLKYPVLRAGIRYSKQLSGTQIDLVLKDVIDDSRIRLTSYRFTNHHELLPYELWQDSPIYFNYTLCINVP